MDRRQAAAGAGRRWAEALGLTGAAALVGGLSFYHTGAALIALSGIAVVGIGLALREARRARLAADKASSDLDFVATRLIAIEHHLRQPSTPAVDPALRSTVAEVSGEIGLLGGIVRDLAETVAAQDRDVATLKERLTTPREPEPIRPSLIPRADVAPPARRPHDQPQPEPSLLPIPRREPAAPDVETRRAAAIMQAFEADRLELHLQPVVTLPQRKVRFYEALARLRLADETILVPAEFLPIIERLGHVAEFDRRVVGRALAVARHLMARGSEAVVSVNLSPRSLDEPGFLRSVGRILEAYPDSLGRIVLELSQRCWRTLDAERAGALGALRDSGVPLSLDRATDLRLDPLALADRGVRFVKLPAEMLVAADAEGGLDLAAGDLASILRRAGIQLVAERVEHEETVPDLIDLDVPLAQGFVFSPPRAVRAEVLVAPSTPTAPQEAPSQAAPAVPTAPLVPAEPAPEPRLPFRAFLRRAG